MCIISIIIIIIIIIVAISVIIIISIMLRLMRRLRTYLVVSTTMDLLRRSTFTMLKRCWGTSRCAGEMEEMITKSKQAFKQVRT